MAALMTETRSQPTVHPQVRRAISKWRPKNLGRRGRGATSSGLASKSGWSIYDIENELQLLLSDHRVVRRVDDQGVVRWRLASPSHLVEAPTEEALDELLCPATAHRERDRARASLEIVGRPGEDKPVEDLERDFSAAQGDTFDYSVLGELQNQEDTEEPPIVFDPIRTDDETALEARGLPRLPVWWEPSMEERDPVLEKPDLRPFPEIDCDHYGRRRRRAIRSHSVAPKQMTRRELSIGRVLYPKRDYWKPRTREDCVEVIRPCPYVTCRWNLYIDVNPATGSIKFNFPDIEPLDMDPRCSCALDVADRGGWSLEDIGFAMNLSRERIRQVERIALGKLRLHQGDYQLKSYT